MNIPVNLTDDGNIYAVTYELPEVKRSLWSLKQVDEPAWLPIGKYEVSEVLVI